MEKREKPTGCADVTPVGAERGASLRWQPGRGSPWMGRPGGLRCPNEDTRGRGLCGLGEKVEVGVGLLITLWSWWLRGW